MREIIYSHPLFRMWDVFIGCNIGYLYLHKKSNEMQEWKYTFWEGISIFGAVISNILLYRMTNLVSLEKMTIDEIWWTSVLVFTVSSGMLVYFFALGRGKISRLLAKRTVLYIAKISPYAFLIHYVVIRYLNFIYYHMPIIGGDVLMQCYGKWINLSLGLFLTMLCSEIWRKINEKTKHRFSHIKNMDVF